MSPFIILTLLVVTQNILTLNKFWNEDRSVNWEIFFWVWHSIQHNNQLIHILLYPTINFEKDFRIFELFWWRLELTPALQGLHLLFQLWTRSSDLKVQIVNLSTWNLAENHSSINNETKSTGKSKDKTVRSINNKFLIIIYPSIHSSTHWQFYRS